MRLIRFAAAIAALLTAVATLEFVPQPTPAKAHHGTQFILCWRTCASGSGQNNVRFTTYDYRQGGWGDVDWPVGFVFHTNASSNNVRRGLCNETTHAWKFCASGGPQYMYTQQTLNPGDGCCPTQTMWDSDDGRKRFGQDCASTEWTAHIRLYAPSHPTGEMFYDHVNGYMVVGTTHLDYRDSNGCSGRYHGGSEAAENWMIGTMSAINNWSVSYNTLWLNNANAYHVVNRTVGGVAVPHEYQNDGYGSFVRVSTPL